MIHSKRITCRVLGLLGAPGSGKSHVARAFAEVGAAVIDADALAREALEDREVQDTLRGWWGPEVFRADGTTDRAAVGRRVFGEADALKRLEGLIHPFVKRGRSALHKRYRDDPAVTAIVEDCPLLLETGLDAGCDRLVYVEASEATRQSRVAEHRGWSAEELARREKLQWPLDIKRQRADYVVRNESGQSDIPTQVREIMQRLMSTPDESRGPSG